ncbi:membrane protein [Streptomyces rimosus subsp. pseudoverticillatus]|uniref:SHOCT domain-containing protein n=1 Tax=Streptomyces rimosus TaxID=1927 RepID=UPI0006B27682|nr:SHOCT domain-containing protein [Streptomyces rimosus]KOT78632.1 membrane protein [Streptomyces rimosus subsp. pseudoverticillatus]
MSGSVTLAYDYPLFGVFWTTFWLFMWILWFFLLFRVIGDIFRDDQLNGWVKTGWIIFVIVLPFLGVFLYVLARGRGMGRREASRVQAQQEAFDAYVRRTAAKDTPRTTQADELTKLSQLRERGDISEEEFQRAKGKVLH